MKNDEREAGAEAPQLCLTFSHVLKQNILTHTQVKLSVARGTAISQSCGLELTAGWVTGDVSNARSIVSARESWEGGRGSNEEDITKAFHMLVC